MANVKFHLEKNKQDKEGQSKIFGDVTFNSQRIRKSLKIKTKPRYWNKGRQRIKPNAKSEPYNNFEEYNAVIDEFEGKVKAIFRQATLTNTKLTRNYILDRLDDKEVSPVASPSFIQIFDNWVEICRATKAVRTITGYITFRNYILEFSKAKNVDITFEALDLEWFERFQTYSFIERKITDNYFAKHITTLKTFLNWATERKHNTNLLYTKYKAKERDSNIICLYKDELLQLLNFPFTSKRLEHVRDTFCFSCFTGQRFSDIAKLQKEHIINGCIQNDVTKTKDFAVIPLIKPAKEILAKYEDYPGQNALPKISHQKYNDYLKECAEMVGLNRPVRIVKYVGGKAIYSTKLLSKVISSHAARKTFITTSLTLGMPREAVKAISGHKKDATFNKYVKLAEDFKKEALETAWSKFE